MDFIKMQGCGNDYIFVDCLQKQIKKPEEAARRLSDRHFGIGADGLVLIEPSRKADFAMRMFNRDGSEGEMCGNAVRCIAKYVYENKITQKKQLLLETKAGIKKLYLHTEHNTVDRITVDMGEPVFRTNSVKSPLDKHIRIDGKVYFMTCISVGNPHAVFFTEKLSGVPLKKIGPKIECHPYFPGKTNVEFVQVINPHKIKVRVWERGSGETMACGTGACAAAMACIRKHKTEEKVEVILPGGSLWIRYYKNNNHIFMTGPAKYIFYGTVKNF